MLFSFISCYSPQKHRINRIQGRCKLLQHPLILCFLFFFLGIQVRVKDLNEPLFAKHGQDTRYHQHPNRCHPNHQLKRFCQLYNHVHKKQWEYVPEENNDRIPDLLHRKNCSIF